MGWSTVDNDLLIGAGAGTGDGAFGGSGAGAGGTKGLSFAFSISSLSRTCGFLIEFMSKPIQRSNNGKEQNRMNIADWKLLPGDVANLFRQYRIISVQEAGDKKTEGYTTANLRKARDGEGKLLGDGPLISQDCLARFVGACTLNGKVDCLWLDWIFVQVGGGEEAKRRAKQAMEQVKERFLDERVRGYRDTKGQYHPPITREQASAKWKGSDPRFQEVLFVADQDMAEKLQVFGFHRHWPGPNKIYEKAVTAVKTFLDYGKMIEEMNEFMRRAEQRDKIIQTNPTQYPTIDALDTAIKKIERFFNSRAAREDVRIETIYEDDILRVSCPITYSAAVLYGWDTWPFANRGIFEQCLEGSNSWNDPWRKTVGNDSKIPIYFTFRCPMPSWVGYESNKFSRITLNNICAVVPKVALTKLVPEAVEFMDEETRKVTIDSICDKIRDEVTRSCNPEEEEYPIQRGPRVFEKAEQADAVVESFEAGWERVVKWASKFNHKQVVVDYMPK